MEGPRTRLGVSYTVTYRGKPSRSLACPVKQADLIDTAWRPTNGDGSKLLAHRRAVGTRDTGRQADTHAKRVASPTVRGHKAFTKTGRTGSKTT